jgi:hypothetical protein
MKEFFCVDVNALARSLPENENDRTTSAAARAIIDWQNDFIA